MSSLLTRFAARRRLSLRPVFVVIVILFVAASAQSSAKPSRNQFLLISDIHFNPMADPALVDRLAAHDPTEWESILNTSKLTAYSQYGEDTNWWLLQSALEHMPDYLPNPAFIMFTGDLLVHQFPQTFDRTARLHDLAHRRAFVLKTVEFLALELRKRYPDTRIFVTPGNDDDDCGNYTIDPHGAFLSDTAEPARKLAHADDAFVTDWKALGSYNAPHPTLPQVRILSLNDIFFSKKYQPASFSKGCSSASSAGAGELFTWLQSNLAKAKQAHEKVWLMFHIPPGIDGFFTVQRYVSLAAHADTASTACTQAVEPLWAGDWTEKFDALLEQFHDTVLAGFSGHTHSDDFRLIDAPGANKLFVLVDPAISPVYGQNPGFRVVTYNADGTLADQTTYYLTNLEHATSTNPGVWAKEYTFTEEWKAKQLDAAAIAMLYDEIKDDAKVRDRWFTLYNVSRASLTLPEKATRGFYCASGALERSTYQSCFCPAPAPAAIAPLRTLPLSK